MSEFDKCPHCRLSSSGANQKEYWALIERYERLALDTKNERELVSAAKHRLSMIAIDVRSMSDPNALCYEEDYHHLHVARNLLVSAANIKAERDKGNER
ncbi:hypothetical protein [Glaciecola sp. 1036]|uniref:hypothetical protein n=1 Tax=Alteromonadaceae TaxID=72275 RepID=UPI003D030131